MNKRNSVKEKLNSFTRDELTSMYEEFETLTNMSKHLDMSIEALRKFFIKNNIDYRKQLVYDVDHNFFSEENEKSFYWAGFLAADGNIAHDKPRIGLQLATKDKSHIEKFKKDINTNAPIYDKIVFDNRPAFKSKIYFKSTLRFTSKQIVKDLKKFNIVPNKTYTYTIPDWIDNHPLCNHFMRGLIDGDGWMSQSIGLCGNKACVIRAAEILIKKCNMPQDAVHLEFLVDKVPRFNVYEVPMKKLVVDFLYKNGITYLDRKQIKAKEFSNSKYTNRRLHLDFTGIDINKSLINIALELNTNKSLVQKKLDEYGIRKIVKKYKYKYNNCFEQDTEEKYYWLGFLFNRASLVSKKHQITVTYFDKSILDKLQKFIEYYNTHIFFTTTKSYRLTISNKYIYSILILAGINNNKISEEIINHNYFNHFLRGMMDGFSSCANDRLTLSSINNNESFRNILINKVGLDIKSKTRLSFRKNNIIKLREYIYKNATIFVSDKMDKLLSV